MEEDIAAVSGRPGRTKSFIFNNGFARHGEGLLARKSLLMLLGSVPEGAGTRKGRRTTMRENPMKRLSGWVILILTAALTTIMLPRQATAEEVGDSEYGATYARVRYVEGEATLLRFMDGEIIQAEINDPLESGDRATTLDGRLEIGLADGATLWLDEMTSVDLRSLADLENRYEQTNLLALIEGSIRIDAGDPADGDSHFQIDTEGGSIYLLSGGSFRVDAERGVTTLSSFRGAAELSGDLGSVLVRSGERASVEAGDGPDEARAFNTLRLDGFDRFHDERVEAYLRRGGDAPIDEIREAVPDSVRPYVFELSVYGGWHHHGV
ncbi:MAG: FecR family protein, partial [Acidobacteriota bacterium]